MPDIDLRPGEQVIAEWRPEFRVFLRKLLSVAFVTALVFGGFGFTFGVIFFLLGVPAAMALYALIFDDYTEWMRHREDVWWLTDQRLLLRDGSESPTPAEIDLAQVARVSSWMWWSLRVRMSNGQGMMMKFLPDRHAIRRSIAEARARHIGGAHA